MKRRSSRPPQKNSPEQAGFRLDGRVFREILRGRIALLGLFFTALAQPARSQEIPRPSVARQKAKANIPTVSNFKVGEVLLRVDTGMTTEFTSNVNLTPEGQSDVILTPTVGVNVAWAATRLNTIRFRTSLGYNYYVNNTQLNRALFTIAPDSALNFDLYAGDFRINFHNQFSLTQDPITQGAVAGVAQLGQFTNTIGTAILWDTNDVIWSFGYDHYNLIITGSASTDSTTTPVNNNINHSTDQASASASVRINSATIGGIEVTGAISDFPAQPQSNFGTFSAGAFAEMQLTRYTHLNLSGGYNRFMARGSNPTSVETANLQPASGNPSGFYATMSLLHRLNRYYSDSLSIGHTEGVDPFSGLAKTDFVRYAGNWRVNEKVSLSAGVFYENVQQVGGGSINGNLIASYERFGLTLATGYQLTEHVGMSLGYQFIKNESVLEIQTFNQSRFTISVGYRF